MSACALALRGLARSTPLHVTTSSRSMGVRKASKGVCPTCGRQGYEDEKKHVVSEVSRAMAIPMKAIMGSKDRGKSSMRVTEARAAAYVVMTEALLIPPSTVEQYFGKKRTASNYWSDLAKKPGVRGQRIRSAVTRVMRVVGKKEADND